ncbi:MAG: response regulator transcription factor [Planctomycetes bacterium]|nr:response regulator transcription factor [Planctomycetota bacterium]
MAEFKFKGAGYDVVCTEDGQEAWEYLQCQRADLLITDCQMPRLDGMGLVERIRASEWGFDLPIIMLTAKGFELPKAELRDRLGVAEIINKPFSPRKLLDRAEALLNSTTTSQTPSL